MAEKPREGSFEELIFRTRRVLGKRETQAFQDSFPVIDRTADQFGVRAAASIEEAENERFPWLKRRRQRRRARP
jgi:hypothetical protein